MALLAWGSNWSHSLPASCRTWGAAHLALASALGQIQGAVATAFATLSYFGDESINSKCLAQCLAYSKHSINESGTAHRCGVRSGVCMRTSAQGLAFKAPLRPPCHLTATPTGSEVTSGCAITAVCLLAREGLRNAGSNDNSYISPRAESSEYLAHPNFQLSWAAPGWALRGFRSGPGLMGQGPCPAPWAPVEVWAECCPSGPRRGRIGSALPGSHWVGSGRLTWRFAGAPPHGWTASRARKAAPASGRPRPGP